MFQDLNLCIYRLFMFQDLNLCDFSPGAPVYGKKDEGVSTGEETDDEEDEASAPPQISRPGGDYLHNASICFKI